MCKRCAPPRTEDGRMAQMHTHSHTDARTRTRKIACICIRCVPRRTEDGRIAPGQRFPQAQSDPGWMNRGFDGRRESLAQPATKHARGYSTAESFVLRVSVRFRATEKTKKQKPCKYKSSGVQRVHVPRNPADVERRARPRMTWTLTRSWQRGG